MISQDKMFPASKTTLWPIDNIKPYEKNARIHPQAQIDLLARMIKKYGADQPIVVDDDGVILKGHGRRLAAIAAGMKKFPVVIQKGLSEAEKSGLRISDNQIMFLSEWNDDLLKQEIAELKELDYDMPMLGFDDKTLVSFFANKKSDDIAPQLEGLKFAVIVECESEQDQTDRLAELVKMGLKCRALIS